jgi:hypothetical protein
LSGGKGRDRVYGSGGRDRLLGRDRRRGDRLSGGSGRDRASADRGDRVISIERVR